MCYIDRLKPQPKGEHRFILSLYSDPTDWGLIGLTRGSVRVRKWVAPLHAIIG